VVRIDPETGDLISQESFSTYGGVWDITFYDYPVYLTVGNDNFGPSVIYRDSIFELPASASHLEFTYLFQSVIAAVTIPGPDFISLIQLDLIGNIHSTGEHETQLLTASPNPFRNSISVDSEIKIHECRILDLEGVLLKRLKPESRSFRIDSHDFVPGVYLLNCLTEDGVWYSQKILKL
jgi:hypothetical protein